MAPRSTAYWLRRASLATAAVSLAWAWATFSYWEALPVLTTVTATGVLAPLSVWVRRRQWVISAGVGVLVAVANLIAVLAITGYRWEG